MNVSQLRALMKDIPNDAEIFWEDPNFGGVFKEADFSSTCIHWYPANNRLMIRPPYWEPVE